MTDRTRPAFTVTVLVTWANAPQLSKALGGVMRRADRTIFGIETVYGPDMARVGDAISFQMKPGGRWLITEVIAREARVVRTVGAS